MKDGNYQEFQRENEEQMTAALSGLLNPGEKLELCFYGITDRRGKKGRRWKKSPCFVGLSGSDLFIAVLKRPSMEETAWTERYSLDVRHVKKKICFSDWCNFEILCVNGDQLRIQCLKMLCAAWRHGRMSVQYEMEKQEFLMNRYWVCTACTGDGLWNRSHVTKDR